MVILQMNVSANLNCRVVVLSLRRLCFSGICLSVTRQDYSWPTSWILGPFLAVQITNSEYAECCCSCSYV